MANLGVFDWIREGVRRSVLLGVSDAFEQLGTADHRAELHPQLATALREASPRVLEDHSESMPSRTATKPERRRLGRSLEQIRTNANKMETAE